MFTCRALIEACLLVEEGVCSVRDIDLGMMAGAGLDPRKGLLPPFWKADVEGLDKVLETMERLEEKLRRALRPADHPEAAGRPGPPRPRDRPGLLPLPAGRRGRAGRDGQARDPRQRRHRLARQPADELALAAGDRGPGDGLGPGQGGDEIGAMVIASSVPVVFSAGADIKAFTTLDAGERRRADQHAPTRSSATSARPGSRRSPRSTRSPSAAAASWRWPATCGSPPRPRSSASPRSSWGSSPASAAPSGWPRLVGPNKALEMNLVGDAILSEEALELGLVNRVVPDHELFETALMWGRKLAGQAPIAVEQIKPVSHQGDIDDGHRGREGRLRHRLRQRGRQRGHQRLPRQAHPEVERQVATREVERLAELLGQSRRAVALTGAGVSVPSGIPDFRTPETGLWAKVDPMEVAHINVFERDPERFWSYYRPRFQALGRQRAEPGPRGAGRAGAAGSDRGRDHPEHRPPAPGGGLGERDRGARLDRDLLLPGVRRPPSGSTRSTSSSTSAGSRSAPPAAARSNPTSSSSASCCPRRRWRGRPSWPKSADLMLCVGSSLAVHPVAGLPQLTLERGGRLAIVTKGATPVRPRRRAEARRRGRRGARGSGRRARLDARLLNSGPTVCARVAGAACRSVGDFPALFASATIVRAGPSKRAWRTGFRLGAAGADRFGADDPGDRGAEAPGASGASLSPAVASTTPSIATTVTARVARAALISRGLELVERRRLPLVMTFQWHGRQLISPLDEGAIARRGEDRRRSLDTRT